MKHALSITLIFTFLVSFGPSASALSCEEIRPRVATIDDFSIMADGGLKLILKWVYSFPAEQISSGQTLAIDNYLKIAADYSADNLDEFNGLANEKIAWNYEELLIKKDFYTKLSLADSDIIITGPPKHLCDDSFLGIFDKNAKLKQIIFKGDYHNLSFLGREILVGPGKELDCIGYSCSVKTNFKIEGKEYALVPSQEISLENNFVSKIFLLNSSAPASRADAEKLFPWGGGRLTEYLLEFNVSLQQEAQENGADSAELEDEQNSESMEESSDPALKIHEAQETKPKNAIARFFAWLKSLFSK
ncbi:MAG: hypothetical protein Q8Q32_02775 [bacterium]|nr:hypothetical protein [bacterium]